jgi:glycosyltransferase involved in cell wall biosynthesis
VSSAVDSCTELGLPSNARVLLCAGPLRREAGFKDAIWTLDILQYLFADVCLVIAGEGPDRWRLETFARNIEVRDRVRFIGMEGSPRTLFQRAEVVWLPGRSPANPHTIRLAMTAGRPVVASATPEHETMVRHGETGFLVPPGDKPALARHTRLLLADADLRRRMAQAARQVLSSKC